MKAEDRSSPKVKERPDDKTADQEENEPTATNTSPQQCVGIETPSEMLSPERTGSPSPRGQKYSGAGGPNSMGAGGCAGGIMCVDQWDWRTDAPEFVPYGMKGMDFAGQGGWAVAMAPPGAHVGGEGATMDEVGGGVQAGEEAQHLRQQFEWQVRSKGEELTKMQNTVNQMEIEIAQVQTSWDMERRDLQRQIGLYRAVLERYCIPVEEAGSGCYDNSADGAYGYDQSMQSEWVGGDITGASLGNAVANNGQGMGFGAAGAGSYGRGAGSKLERRNGLGQYAIVQPEATPGTQGTSTLDSKMRQLNNLLHEGSLSAPVPEEQTERDRGGDGGETGGEGGGSIESTLRAMFPHATIRTTDQEGGEDWEGEVAEATEQEAQEVEEVLRNLEAQVGRQVDERALRSLHGLRVRDRMEALGKVCELVNSQGGHCRNLSSILQSVCRKIEKRSTKSARAAAESAGATPQLPGRSSPAAVSPAAAGAGGGAAGGRRQEGDEPKDESAATNVGAGLVRPILTHQDSAGSETLSTPKPKPNTPAGRSSNHRSWADMHSGDEDDHHEEGGEPADKKHGASAPDGGAQGDSPTGGSEGEDHWTSRRIEKAARRSFDLRSKGGQWELKINMSGQEPPLSKTGMEKYCKWLRSRLSSFRDEHGPEPLRRCRGEVDFSNDKMSDEMVWMLLETLTQHEVHVAVLKLYANEISQGGVLAICEFIRANQSADAVQELHLSHNEIDDDSALELLKTLNLRPRYPPRRPHESTGEMVVAPVWLRLNHNRVKEPEAVRRAAESDGVMICTASDRNVCGTSRCGCPGPDGECPSVHLYTFKVQS